ncbi:hypothetical protein X975_23599, partial [Stegodyphus mimosarum]
MPKNLNFPCSPYRKLFIRDVLERASYEKPTISEARCIVRAHVMGLITSMKRYQQRTVFYVDDGTGQLECVLWHNGPAIFPKMSDLKKGFDIFIAAGTLCDEIGPLISLLKKVELNEMDPEKRYKPGSMIEILGIVRMFRGRLLLNIRHHRILFFLN